MEKFFSKPHDKVLKNFNVSKSGLTENQVKENLDKFGYNQLTEKQKQLLRDFAEISGDIPEEQGSSLFDRIKKTFKGE